MRAIIEPSGNQWMKPCPECRGAKLVEDYQWERWRWEHRQEYTALLKDGMGHQEAWIKAAEKVGPAPDCPEETPCHRCDGRGMEATREGEELLRFLDVFKG